MKKLFKEVWKSFSKSKIILFGLTFLVFLTSGTITLILDIVKTYSTQYEEYKKISKLHDLTLNSDITPTGNKPNSIYGENTKRSISSDIWSYEGKVDPDSKALIINTTDKYINLRNMLNNNSEDLYVSSQDLSYLLNSNLKNIKNNVFTPQKNQISELKIYDPSIQGDDKGIYFVYNKISKINTWNNTTGTWEDISSAYSLLNIENENISSLNTIIIDLKTGIGYLEKDFIKPTTKMKQNSIYKQWFQEPGTFYNIEQNQLAQLLGLKLETKETKALNPNKQPLFNVIYKDDNKMKDWILEGPKKVIQDVNEYKNIKVKQDFKVNTNDTFKEIKIQKSILLKQNLTIPKDWFTYSKTRYEFKRTNGILEGIENDRPKYGIWSGMYFNYLNYVRNNDYELWKHLKDTSYWTKKQYDEIVDIDGNVIQLKNGIGEVVKQETKGLDVKIWANDLTLPLKKDKEVMSIVEIEKERIGSRDINQDLADFLSTNNITKNENTINLGAKNFAYQEIYNEIQEICNGIDNIGFRQYLTTSSNENGETNIFQFINVGNNNKEINWNGIGVKQNVGKLYNSTKNTGIYNLKSNINPTSPEVPIKHIPDILEKLLKGLSLNREYINPMISFESILPYDDNGNLNDKNAIGSSKIVWMQSQSSEQIIGISGIKDKKTGNIKYLPLKQNNNSNLDIKTKWIPFHSFGEFDGSKESLINFVNSNKLNFSNIDYNGNRINVVGKKGWAKQNSEFSDQFSVPFQYWLPSSEIIEKYNSGLGFALFTNRLIKDLTENVKPLISPQIWRHLMDSVNVSFTKYGFGESLTPPAGLSKLTIEKISLGTFYEGINTYRQSFTNSLVVDILNGILLEIQKHPNIEEQRAYVKGEINKIGQILLKTVGIDISSFLKIIDNANPVTLFSSLIDLVNSINLDKVVLELYNSIFLNNSRAQNQIISSADYLPAILKNITNKKVFFNSIINIIKSINIIPDWAAETIKLISMNDTQNAVANIIHLAKMNYDKETDSFYNSITLKEFLNSVFSILKKPFGDFVEGLLPEEQKKSFNEPFDQPYNRSEILPLELDRDLMWYLTNYVFMDGSEELFKVKIPPFLTDAIDAFTEVRNDESQIVFQENSSKVAMVSESILHSKNKQIYHSNTLSEDLNDLSKIDEKYKIKISNVEYVITGVNFTVDYMYPVINAENIQVNPNNQNLVYVNQNGFDRIRRSNINSPIESYFLLSSKNPLLARTKLNQLVYSQMTGGGIISEEDSNKNSNPYKKAFLAKEYMLINPERSLRLSIVDQLLNNLTKIQLWISIFLITITAIVISFVVRRWISSRAKVIGILKAQGYSSLKISLSICLFSVVVALIGGSFGYIAGHFSQYGMFKLLSLFWVMPVASAGFNWMTLVLFVFVPFILLSLLIILVSLWFLRKNAITLMNGSLELNETKISNTIKKSVNKTSIKNKFSVSLALSSVSKLFALFASMLVTSAITLFFISTFNIFQKSVDNTYKHRNYVFKIDLKTPTVEGGKYASIDLNQKHKNNQWNNNIDIKDLKNQFPVDNMLYVPSGKVEEGYTYKVDYFKPGYNSIINVMLDGKPANGNLDINDTTTPHIFTKSSVDLTVLAGGLSINVWQNLFNTIPESQRTSIVQISQDAGEWLEWTQEGNEIWVKGFDHPLITKFENFGTNQEYLTLFDPQSKTNVQVFDQLTNSKEDIKIEYFKYKKDLTKPQNSKFIHKKVTMEGNKYFDNTLIISGTAESIRDRGIYRDFLVKGYEKMFDFNNNENKIQNNADLPFERSKMPKFVLDYFIMPGANTFGNDFNNIVDETYTYVSGTINNSNNQNIKIYGYNENSQFISIVNDHQRNLIKEIEKIKIDSENPIYPIIVNNVVAQKYNLHQGQEIDLTITNHFKRLQTKLNNALNNLNESHVAKFKIIGISDTWINEEFVTSKLVANLVLGLPEESYNGIFTNNSQPLQIVNSLGLYAESGYWSALESFQVKEPDLLTDEEKDTNYKIYQELFYKIDHTNKQNKSLIANNMKLLNPDLTDEQINIQIKKMLFGKNMDKSLDLKGEGGMVDNNLVYSSLQKFIGIYTNKALQSSLDNVVSNGIEKEYVQEISSTMSDGMLIIMTLSFAISLTILVMITSMIINENERNIAIFGILGYSNKEKIRMFFSIYIPIVLIALLIAIPIIWGLIPVFSSVILSTSSIALSLEISWSTLLISSIIVIGVFSLTCLISWMIQGRIKPIILLKGV